MLKINESNSLYLSTSQQRVKTSREGDSREMNILSAMAWAGSIIEGSIIA